MHERVKMSGNSPNMVFHYPTAFPPNYISGSVVRPKAMARAFEAIGYNVHLIWGTAAERKASMKRLFARIDAGEKFEFVYSESVNSPTLLTEKHHLPTYPLLEPMFFHRLKRRGIPLGLFYRDMYWRFPVYDEQVPLHKAMVAKAFYHFDLWLYRRYLDVLFLPSLEMLPLLRSSALEQIAAHLPPGFPSALTADKQERIEGPLSIVYVGGVLPPVYDLSPLFRAVVGRDVRLTVVCRQKEWQSVLSLYEPLLGPNVEVLHVSGSELEKVYRRSNVAAMVMKPDPYRDIMMPLKLFEAIGHGLPILAMDGFAASRFIQDNNLGWVAKTADELTASLDRLVKEPSLIDPMKAEVLRQRTEHTWEARAKKAAGLLTRIWK
jgi:hypothetical protein